MPPALVTVPNVPLMMVGENWKLASGVTTFTADDLASAVQAQDDPGLRTPIVKIGHTDKRFDGQPCIGKIMNMRLGDEGMTLYGDLVGVPGWLAEILPYTYPQRSVEGGWEVTTATGNTHRFALTAVALLGETDPGISTLPDLQAKYDELPIVEVEGVSAKLLVRASTGGGGVPQRSAQAAVEAEDVRRAFYDNPELQNELGTWAWVRAIRLDPTDLIVDDDEGQLYRVPYTIAGTEVTFGDPVSVVIEYQDATVAASAGGHRVAFASSRESRRGTVAEARADRPDPQEGLMDLTALRTRLGLGDEVSDEDVLTAAAAALPEPTAEGDKPKPGDAPPKPGEGGPDPDAPPGTEESHIDPATLPEGVQVIDTATLVTLQEQAAAGAAARERQRTEDRDRFITAAVKEGRIVPARASHWKAQYDKDEAGTRQFIESQPKGLVPVTEIGNGNDNDVEASAADYNPAWLSPSERARVTAARGEQ